MFVTFTETGWPIKRQPVSADSAFTHYWQLNDGTACLRLIVHNVCLFAPLA